MFPSRQASARDLSWARLTEPYSFNRVNDFSALLVDLNTSKLYVDETKKRTIVVFHNVYIDFHGISLFHRNIKKIIMKKDDVDHHFTTIVEYVTLVFHSHNRKLQSLQIYPALFSKDFCLFTFFV